MAVVVICSTLRRELLSKVLIEYGGTQSEHGAPDVLTRKHEHNAGKNDSCSLAGATVRAWTCNIGRTAQHNKGAATS